MGRRRYAGTWFDLCPGFLAVLLLLLYVAMLTPAGVRIPAVTRKSQSGYVFTLANAAIQWKSKLQTTVALSSTEAEYLALSAAVKDGPIT